VVEVESPASDVTQVSWVCHRKFQQSYQVKHIDNQQSTEANRLST